MYNSLNYQPPAPQADVLSIELSWLTQYNFIFKVVVLVNSLPVSKREATVPIPPSCYLTEE